MALKFDTTINVGTLTAVVSLMVAGAVGYVRTAAQVETNTDALVTEQSIRVISYTKLENDLDLLRENQTGQAISFGKMEANIENIIRLLENQNSFGAP